ncbi:MAG: gliding-motility protein MglA, partial [Deltaproteobacteria bacterium]|nr:gliding-motility protein MglA [Deltaproteobacteria bacterium]
NLEEQGYDLDKLPFVIQYNKQDLSNLSPMDELQRFLNPNKVLEFKACAMSGVGVFETLKGIAKMVLMDLKKGSR